MKAGRERHVRCANTDGCDEFENSSQKLSVRYQPSSVTPSRKEGADTSLHTSSAQRGMPAAARCLGASVARTTHVRVSRPRGACAVPRASASAVSSDMMRVGDLALLPPTIAAPHHPTYSIADAIRTALEEDVADVGDISCLSTIPIETESTATLLAKANGVLAGQHLANQILAAVDSEITVKWTKVDGDPVKYGEIFCEMNGKAHSILRAERVLLNFMQRMSGIATLTKAMATAAAPALMLETRKTVPGLRLPDKWAVLVGGGKNHRMGLFDMIMIKDNHIAASGGIECAVENAQSYLKENKSNAKIEVETRNMGEVEQVIALLSNKETDTSSVSRVMLDNMSLEDMKTAVQLFETNNLGHIETEASGNVTLETVHAIGQTGVTFISSGALTHSVMALDISLNVSTE